MFATFLGILALGQMPSPSQLIGYGDETFKLIESNYRLPNSPLYRDVYDPNHSKDQPAFCWGVGVELSALNAAVASDRSKSDRLRSFADGIQVYWNSKGPVAGFDVLPGPKDVDRYYDDNEWMVMALAETSDRLHNKKYLTMAEDALKYVLSGEDSVLGGGVYWKENGKTSKNTCSNGPAAAACLAIYSRTHEASLLTKAENIYAWCKSHLQDPSDSLYWDNISLKGDIGKAKFTYNTALMLRSASELYRITKKPNYLADAKQMVSSSVDHWYQPDSGAMKDDGRFAHLLIESWIWAKRDIPGAFEGKDFPALIRRPLAYIYDHARLNGFYGHRWDRPDGPNTKHYELIDQAAAARAYYLVGNLKN